ncbi:hypothetical protein [Streptomyces sp. NBC_00239]|uniref:hypothetical protein n=1 Tax=Streptomyces sp. NBC_00239 TaxID=2903640 RepID=UPI002E2A84A5|nr:hypothetical protein [Streptomyces sp. NBC_00239]
MCAIVTAEMAALTDEELRLSFELMHGVPRQSGCSERGLMLAPEESPGSGPNAAADRGIEELLAWVAAQGAQALGAGDISAE